MRQVQIVDLAGSERLKPYEDGSQQDKARDGDGELVKQGIFLGFFCWIYSGFTHWKWWFNGILLGYPLVMTNIAMV